MFVVNFYLAGACAVLSNCTNYKHIYKICKTDTNHDPAEVHRGFKCSDHKHHQIYCSDSELLTRLMSASSTSSSTLLMTSSYCNRYLGQLNTSLNHIADPHQYPQKHH